jgi:cyclo(L-tyrosyl-L-tyrosyl) synthase
VHATPITSLCSNSFERREHICFGISPFNSYFTENRIESLARWGTQNFRSIHFFVPDAPTAFTLEAVGYTPEKAAWKARRQCQYLHNKIHRAVSKLGLVSNEISDMILNGESLGKNQRYLDLCESVNEHFNEDLRFQTECLEASSWVLEGKLPPGSEITEEQRRHAVKYLLAEIPLFLNTKGIVGTPSSVFAYHQCVPFIESLIRGNFGLKRDPAQGFLVVEPMASNPLEVALTLFEEAPSSLTS